MKTVLLMGTPCSGVTASKSSCGQRERVLCVSVTVKGRECLQSPLPPHYCMQIQLPPPPLSLPPHIAVSSMVHACMYIQCVRMQW